MNIRDFLSTCKWKLKAIKRAKENKALNKRIKELITSRDKIKIKNKKLSVEKREMENRIKELDDKLKKN